MGDPAGFQPAYLVLGILVALVGTYGWMSVGMGYAWRRSLSFPRRPARIFQNQRAVIEQGSFGWNLKVVCSRALRFGEGNSQKEKTTTIIAVVFVCIASYPSFSGFSIPMC